MMDVIDLDGLNGLNGLDGAGGWNGVYKDGMVFQLLVCGHDAGCILEDWYRDRMKGDLRVRRAKTLGCCVIETTDLLFAARVIRRNPGTRVHVRE